MSDRTCITLACWPRLLDVHLAATYASVGEATIRDWIVEKVLKPVQLPGSRLRKPGGAVTSFSKDHNLRKTLIAREDLDALIDSRKGVA